MKESQLMVVVVMAVAITVMTSTKLVRTQIGELMVVSLVMQTMTLALCIHSIQVGVVATIPLNSYLRRCAASVEVAEL
jgi:hypothetical protein